jgi:hypothetical protein
MFGPNVRSQSSDFSVVSAAPGTIRTSSGLGLFLMAAVGLGLFVSSIAATMQQAMLYAFLLVMPFALLSGLTNEW